MHNIKSSRMVHCLDIATNLIAVNKPTKFAVTLKICAYTDFKTLAEIWAELTKVSNFPNISSQAKLHIKTSKMAKAASSLGRKTLSPFWKTFKKHPFFTIPAPQSSGRCPVGAPPRILSRPNPAKPILGAAKDSLPVPSRCPTFLPPSRLF